MLTNPASDAMTPRQLYCLSVCNTGVWEPQEVRAYRRDKGVADSAGNRYSNMYL